MTSTSCGIPRGLIAATFERDASGGYRDLKLHLNGVPISRAQLTEDEQTRLDLTLARVCASLAHGPTLAQRSPDDHYGATDE